MATGTNNEKTQGSLPMKGAKAPVKAEGFNHLHLNVRDLRRSVRFYKEAFGLKVGFSAGPELIFMVPEVGGHSLALHLVAPDEPIGMAWGFSALRVQARRQRSRSGNQASRASRRKAALAWETWRSVPIRICVRP